MNLRPYYELTKPGIIYGNALTAAAAYLFAVPNSFSVFVYMILGLSAVIASACVFNNYFDIEIDRKMERTSGRPLVRGSVSKLAALLFGTMLGLLGAGLLLLTTLTAFLVAAAGWFVYVVLYTPLKHKSAQALWVGALAGATPPVVGYTAVTNTLDANTYWLFLFLFLWQIPHFVAIAVYRFHEYQSAGVPLLITKEPSLRAQRLGRKIFLASLVLLLLWCTVIALWPYVEL